MEALVRVRSGWSFGRGLAVAVWLLLVVGALAGASAIITRLDLRAGPNEYNIGAWETRHFANKWLFELGALFRSAPSVDEENVIVSRFFQLTREISALEREKSDGTQRGLTPDAAREEQLIAKRKERSRIENQVEATIEGRIAAVLENEGLARSFLFLPAIVWPPVDFEFTNPPRTLAVSPRDRIDLKSSSLLREDLDLEEIERIETERERKGGVSALAFPTSGIGAYPAIVEYSTEYRALLELVAHEWMHNYLFFRPLGFSYHRSYDLRSMNETVADLVGREIAAAVIARWPLEQSAAAPAPPAGTGVDVGAELRKLRGEVEALLAAAKVEAAEALMERRREELAAQGVRIRKINQAYFAFTNLYAGEAGNPAATNPIGPKIDELRRRSPSLQEFVRVIGGITSVEGLNRALSQRQ